MMSPAAYSPGAPGTRMCAVDVDGLAGRQVHGVDAEVLGRRLAPERDEEHVAVRRRAVPWSSP